MKYMRQILVILLFSFLGEALHILLPLPIPASIYGMVLLFAALALKLVRLEWVKDAGHFLVNIMAIMFISPAVGLLNCWNVIRENLLSILVIIAVSLVLTFWSSGAITQAILKREEKNHA